MQEPLQTTQDPDDCNRAGPAYHRSEEHALFQRETRGHQKEQSIAHGDDDTQDGRYRENRGLGQSLKQQLDVEIQSGVEQDDAQRDGAHQRRKLEEDLFIEVAQHWSEEDAEAQHPDYIGYLRLRVEQTTDVADD